MSDHESIPLFFARPWGVGRRARDRMPAGGRTHVTGVHGVVAHVVVHTNTTSMVLPRHSTHTFCDATKNTRLGQLHRERCKESPVFTSRCILFADGLVTVRVAVLFLLHMSTTRTTRTTTTTRGASARGNT